MRDYSACDHHARATYRGGPRRLYLPKLCGRRSTSMILTAPQTRFVEGWFLAEWHRRRPEDEECTPRALAGRLAERCSGNVLCHLDKIDRWPDEPDALHGILSSHDLSRKGSSRDRPLRGRQLAAVRSQVRKVLFQSASRLARDLNSQSLLARRLPLEIFGDILSLLPFKDRLVASHVCHGWRDAAVSEPRLWSDIVLSVPNLTWSLAAVPDLLARSRAIPLRLTIMGLYSEDVPHIAHWITRDILERSRFLALFFDAGSDLGPLWDALAAPAPLLETLVLRSTDASDDDCIFRLPEDLFLGCAPKLREVHSTDVRVTSGCRALDSVEVLVADFVGQYTGDDEIFAPSWSLLSVFPSLSYVGLNDVRLDDCLPSMAGVKHLSLLASGDDDPLIPSLPALEHTAVQHITLYTKHPYFCLRDLCVDLPVWTKVRITTDFWPTKQHEPHSALSIKAWHGDLPTSLTRTVVFEEFCANLGNLIDDRLASDKVSLEISEHVLTVYSGTQLVASVPSVRKLLLMVEPNAQGDALALPECLAVEHWHAPIELPDLLEVVIVVPPEAAHRVRSDQDLCENFSRIFAARNLESFILQREFLCNPSSDIPSLSGVDLSRSMEL